MIWQLAAYVAIGFVIIQWMHTYYCYKTFYQKRIIGLELIFEDFKRQDPNSLEDIQPLLRPSQLEQHQPIPDALPPILKTIARKLGLHATNIIYSLVAAVVLGLISFGILTITPSAQILGPFTFIVYPLVFGLLIGFSELFVGVGGATSILESSLCAFVLLISLSRTPILSQFALNTMNGVIIAASIGVLVEWGHSEAREERIKYGDPPEESDEISGVFYIVISYGYILFGYLTLMSLYGGL
jgi:hypothetical protein